MSDGCVLEVVWPERSQHLPALIGPFEDEAEAQEWGRLNVQADGVWLVRSLAYPYMRADS